MRKFGKDKVNSIRHFYKDNNYNVGITIKRFKITYKEFYKVIEGARILNFKEVDGITFKKCISCGLFKPYNDEHYYRRKGTNSFTSSCKKCMKLLYRNYSIVKRKSRYESQKDYLKSYYERNKNKIIHNSKQFYLTNRERIIMDKKRKYSQQKNRFLKSILFKLR